jgi:acylglycerol lipase
MIEAQEAFFACSDAYNIFYRYTLPRRPKACVIILHGYGEHSGRYGHVISHLTKQGFACFAPDHRGHGQSARLMGYVKSFERIIMDIHELRLFIEKKYRPEMIFIFGHSMGGMLTLYYLLNHREGIRGAVINAPMIIVPGYISPLLKALSGVIAALFPTLPVQNFDPTETTHDPEVIAADKVDPLCYHGKIRARTGVQMLKAMETVGARLAEITTPLLFIQGDADKTLPVESSSAAYNLVASGDKTLKYFKGLYHETWNEPERDAVIRYIADWFEKKLP